MKRSPLLLAASLFFAACGSSGSAPPRAESRVQILPAQGQTYFLFGDGTVEERAGAEKVASPVEAPAGIGLPSACGIDLGGEFGVVAYPHQLARVKLSEHDVTWMPASWKESPRTIAVKGSLALALGEKSLTWVRLDDDKEAPYAELAPFLSKENLGPVHFAAPLSDREFALITHEGSSARIVRVDRSSGQWKIIDDKSIPNLHALHATATDGTALYLAGVEFQIERTGVGPGLNSRQRVFLVVDRIDYDHFSVRQLVRRELEITNWRVTSLSVGLDLVMLVLEDGTVSVYRVNPSGTSSAPVLERPFSRGVQAAWLGEKRIAVVDPRGQNVTIVEDLAGNR